MDKEVKFTIRMTVDGSQKIVTATADINKFAEEIEKAAGEVVKTYVLANVDKQVAAKVFFDARYDLSEADRRAIV